MPSFMLMTSASSASAKLASRVEIITSAPLEVLLTLSIKLSRSFPVSPISGSSRSTILRFCTSREQMKIDEADVLKVVLECNS